MTGDPVEINLLGDRFSIQTDQEPAYIQGLLRNLTKKIQDIQEKTNIKDPVKVAILVSLSLEDTLAKYQARSSGMENHRKIEQLRLHMIQSIEKVLKN